MISLKTDVNSFNLIIDLIQSLSNIKFAQESVELISYL